jgi:predicted dithiol-disulfide oxidoreductase (DUF899 family)
MPKIKTVHGTENRNVVSRKEWLTARRELLKAEKEFTRRSDELASAGIALGADRQKVPLRDRRRKSILG